MPQPPKTKRNNQIKRLRKQGVSLGLIAKAYRLSKTRVVQILNETGRKLSTAKS